MSTSGPTGIPPRPPESPFPPRPVPTPRVASGKAIASVFFGFLGFFFWVFAALPAIVLALVARSDIRQSPDRLTGKGIANLGLLMGVMGIFVAPFLSLMMLGAMMAPVPTTSYSGDRIAHIDISGLVTDMPVSDPFMMMGPQGITVGEILLALDSAATDDSVLAVVITSDGFGAGPAAVEEMAAAMDAVRDAGKEILVHTAALDTIGYALFSHATHINMVPTDFLFLTGLASESLYASDALENMHLKFDVLHIGDYKAAGETFTRNEPSAPAEANMNWLMDGLYDNVVATIASGRELEASEVRKLIDDGPYTAESALKAGLTDSVLFHDEFLDKIRADFGEDVYFDDRYASDSLYGSAQPASGFSELFEVPSADSIAVVSISGTILGGYGPTTTAAFGDSIRNLLEYAAKDDSIAAVVLRVDSPGGSVTASEVILRAVKKLQEVKPVVVSMGEVAASGGYYISCSADAIFVDRSTITGSIGVVGGKMVTTGLWDELGVNWHAYHRGQHAGIMGSAQPFTESERRTLRAQFTEAYDMFIDHVETGRGDKLKQPMSLLAGGRVYTGNQALEAGLVDEIGGIVDAVEHAAELAEIDDYAVRLIPEPQEFFQALMDELYGTGNRESDLQSNLRNALAQMIASQAPETPMSIAAKVDPRRAAMVERTLMMVQLVQQESVVAIAPELLHLGR